MTGARDLPEGFRLRRVRGPAAHYRDSAAHQDFVLRFPVARLARGVLAVAFGANALGALYMGCVDFGARSMPLVLFGGLLLLCFARVWTNPSAILRRREGRLRVALPLARARTFDLHRLQGLELRAEEEQTLCARMDDGELRRVVGVGPDRKTAETLKRWLEAELGL